ncbi:MAG TPA: MupA/Atu3671 family FMN-dependent luciferase-like monooxygenase [Pyrinomonadaceae bacterium]|nr:MupA/Atu3671 family FMN-dependent luciferase-like monooxygenase [Pyrinomonadaceae bacterium]
MRELEDLTIREDDIAVVGLAGRLPGAKDLHEFWRNLCDGVEAIRFFSDEELLQFGANPETLKQPNCVKAKAIIENVDMFDAAFFGFTAREAQISDPQQRIFLECSWEALEDAGYDPEAYPGKIGVYAGSGFSSYMTVIAANPEIARGLGTYRTLIGNDKDFLATLVSYKLNLRGPSVVIQTACSTSLVAVHVACQALLNGECDMALAGGISIRLPEKGAYLYQEGGILSPDGHCRAFDAEAEGTVSGNGAALVVLKRFADALKDGDNIRAVIKGSAVNNDGAAKVGFTAPSIGGQVQVINQALDVSGVDAQTISYIEAHGTGTALGDPVEVTALTKALGAKTSKRGFCAIGSLKTNVGHLDVAAGAASLIKSILMLQHKKLPPSLHFQRPNPKIDFANSPFYVQTHLAEWTSETPRRAGVSSFGIGGTNAHVIVEEAPARERTNASRHHKLLLLSAKTESALETVTDNIARYLDENADTDLADVAYTLQVGRRPMEHRRMLVCRDREGALNALTSRDPKRVFTTADKTRFRPVMFMFPGQGSQHVNMAHDLYRDEPYFKQLVDECAEILARWLDLDLRGLLYPSEARSAEASEKLTQTQFTQPALFVIEYCLARLWMHWGIKPEAMIGHSLGEYVAACLAGVFTLEEALPLIAMRGRLVAEMPTGHMLAVRLPETELLPLLNGQLSLAAVNSSSQCVVAGDEAAVATLQQLLNERSVACSRLNTSHAMHSPAMDPILASLTQHFERITLRPPSIRYLSNVTGTWIEPAEACSPGYWAKHIRQTVRFAQGVEHLLNEPDAVLLEVGPGRTLCTLAQQMDRDRSHAMFTSLPPARTDQNASAFATQTLGSLWMQGASVNWANFHSHEKCKRIPLPTYPFERERYWVPPPASRAKDKVIEEVPLSLAEESESFTEQKPEAFMPEQSNPVPTKSARRDAILSMLHSVAYKLIGIETTAKDIHVSFFDLGVDSLLIIQFTQAIQEQCGVRIPFRLLFEDLTTLDAVSHYLDEQLPPEMYAPAPEPAPQSVPIPPPSVPSAAPDLTEQLRLITQQLELLQQKINAPAPALVETPSAPEPFIPHKPLEIRAANDLTAQQHEYLADFTRRYIERTAGSKRIAQASRRSLADSRLSVGFSLLLKELVYPIYAQRSAGSKIWDVDGNEYVDISMGYGVNLFGNSPSFIREAIEEQLKDGMALAPQLELTAKVAAMICEMTGVERVNFCNSGTEAVMGALRAARVVTQRRRFAMFAGSYHGWSDLTMARSLKDKSGAMPTAPGINSKTVEDLLVLDYGDPQSLEILKAQAHELAAVLVEPVQSRRPDLQPREFLHELRKITSESGTALIIDEMITGFRIHPGGAQHHFGVQADLATYGKIVGGGLPIGVVAGKSKFMDCFDGGYWNFGDASYPQADKTFFAAAFFKHPLVMAAASAVLKRLKDDGPALQERVNRQTEELVTTLNTYFEQESVPLHCVHFGSLFRFVTGREFKHPELFGYHLFSKGIHVWDGGNYFLSTAHTQEDIRKVVDAVTSTVEDLRGGGFLPRRPDGPSTPPKPIHVEAPSGNGHGQSVVSVSSVAAPPVASKNRTIKFSLYYFGNYWPEFRDDKYDLIFATTRFADEHGFEAVWIPERHFDSFGGFSPNPSVMAAALARETNRIQIRAGSVALPLHNPIRVAEEWALVDNLSKGRVGISFASGWHRNDFVLAPNSFHNRRELMHDGIETVRRLWRGESVSVPGVDGQSVDVKLVPMPMQPELPFWLTVASPTGGVKAGEMNAGFLTNFMGRTLEDIAERIALYRQAATANHGPNAGHVTVQIHAFLGDDLEKTREKARGPLAEYLQASVALKNTVATNRGKRPAVNFAQLPKEDLQYVFSGAFKDYVNDALIGTPDHCVPVVDKLIEAGVDELCCLIDFGVDLESTMESLHYVNELKKRYEREPESKTESREEIEIRSEPEIRPAAAKVIELPRKFPMTEGQKQLWTLAQLSDDANGGYNESSMLHMRGALDVDALYRTMQKLADRHEAMRITYSEDGEHQYIHSRVKVSAPVFDLSGLSDEERKRKVDEWSKAEMRQSFDLARGPLFKFRLARLEPQYHVLIFTYHHSIIDGQSLSVFFKEFNAIYGAECRGEVCSLPEPRQFSDYLQDPGRQRSEVTNEANEAYWLKAFAGGVTLLNLPADHPRPATHSFKRERYTAYLGPEITHQVQQWCRSKRCTAFLMMLTVFKVLLHKLTGQRVLLVGITTADGDGVKRNDLMGFRLNGAPLQSQIAGDPTFNEFLLTVKGLMWEAYEHQDVSLSRVFRLLKVQLQRDRLSPLSVKFNLDRSSEEMDFNGIKVTIDANPTPAPIFDLTLDINEKPDETILQWNYNPQLFEESTIQKWMGYFETLLTAVLAESERPLSALPPDLTKPITVAKTFEPTLPAANGNGHGLGLTKLQLRIWTWEKLFPNEPIYNQGGYLLFPMLIDREHFSRAIAKLIQNVDAFRTIIREKEGVPYQHILPEHDSGLEHYDFTSAVDPMAAFNQWAREACQTTFNLEKSLTHFALVKLGDNSSAFYMNIHHMIADASSVMLTERLVSDYYQLSLDNRLEEAKPLPSFHQSVRREQEYLSSARAASSEAYWVEKVADPIEPLAFYGKPASKPTNRIKRINETIDAMRMQMLRAAARDKEFFFLSPDASLFCVLTAIFATYIHRVSGSRKLSIGVPFHNRRSKKDDVIGLFMNILPMRLVIDDDETFLTLTKKVQGEFARMLRHSEYPVGNTALDEAYDLVFNYVNVSPLYVFNGIPIVHEVVRSQEGKESLAFTLRVGGKDDLVVQLDAHRDVFDEYHQGQIFNHFVCVIDRFLEDRAQQLRRVELLTTAERKQLVEEFNNTEKLYPHQRSFSELFEQQAEKTPDSIVVSADGQCLTYASLKDRANGLAQHLRSLGIGPESIVGLLAHRGIDFLTAMLATFKAGAACLPLDPTAPDQRLAHALSQGDVALVLVANDCTPNIMEALDLMTTDNPPRFQQIEDLLSKNYSPATAVGTDSTPRNLSYVIYTSGSTGAPKGAMVEQQGMMNHLFLKIDDLQLDQQTRIAQTAPQSFDIFVWQALAALLVGGSVHIVSDEQRRDPASLHEQVEREGVTVLEIVPSFLRAVLDLEEASEETNFSWSSLKLLVLTGEALPSNLCRRWLRRHPNIPILNAYGPTECSDDVTHNFISTVPQDAPEIAPVGRAVGNTQIYILDEDLLQVPLGMTGEVCVGGIGVGRGYLIDPEKTSKTFVPNPYATKPGERLYRTADLGRQLSDGTIEFLGRIDHQVKIRGYRIEPGEIEAHLAKHPALKEATVVGREVEPGVKRLVAYVVPRTSEGVTNRELRAFLERRLPQYMVPSAFVTLEELPLTASGKIDRKSLPLPSFEREEDEETFVAPASPVEEVLAGIWRKALRLEQIGVNDNFFELGGDSILAVQVAVRAKQAGLKLAPIDIFENQTLAELAEKVGSQSFLQAEQGQVTGPVPITPSQRRWLATGSINEINKATTIIVDLQPEVDPDLLEQALEQLISHHDALRLRFTQDGTDWHQFNNPIEHSRPLVRMDLSHLPEAELSLACDTVIANLQAELDLTQGTTIQAAYMRLAGDQRARLVLAVHALAADDQSWEILLGDLQFAYEQLSGGETVRFAPKTTSFKQWAQSLLTGASELDASGAEPEAEDMSPLPVHREGETVIREFDTIDVSLNFSTLIGEDQEPPDLEWDQLSLRALKQVIATWAETDQVLIDVLTDARSEPSDTVNLSRTVGQLTIGRADRRAQLTFGFMGQSDLVVFESCLFARPLETLKWKRAHTSMLEVFGSITGRQIRFEWAFSKQHFYRVTIEELSTSFAEALEALIKSALTGEGEYTEESYLNDFNWGQKDLDRVKALVAAGKPQVTS